MARNSAASDIDLHHLRILMLLLEERHVSRTADRLGLTQSAVSKALGKMRTQFADTLLIRGPGGYKLTHKARSIDPMLRTVLAQLDQLLSYTSAAPENLDAEIRVGMTDDVATVFLPQIFKHLKVSAPELKLTVINADDIILDKLRSGSIDLLIDDAPERGSGFYTRSLCKWSYCCLMRPDHPFALKKLTISRLVKTDHGLVSFTGTRFGRVDEILGSLDRQRRVEVVLPYFSAVPNLLECSDLIFIMPEPLGRWMVGHFDLVSKPLPIELQPLDISLIWHPRNQYDSVHQWFRRFLTTDSMLSGFANS